MEVPSEIRLSIGDNGSEVIVAGLSPVNGVMIQSQLARYRGYIPFEK